jgi:hypothetical protein
MNNSKAVLLTSSLFWGERVRASLIHLGLSLFVAALAGLLVFVGWYPYPYSEISGGRELFQILVAVDVILGPLITLAIFNRAKPWSELKRDLLVVVALQLGALGYGIWTVFIARPVHLVFEVYRFNVVHAIDVPLELVGQTSAGIEALPMTGPTLLSLRPFKDEAEKTDATLAAFKGLSLAARPDLWQSYEKGIPDVLKEAKPLALLKSRFPNRVAEIDKVLAPFGSAGQGMVTLPMVGRKSFWTVFVDPVTAEVKAFMPLDSF